MPPMHPVDDLFAGRTLTAHGLPLVAIHIPEDGRAEPQGARRTEGVRPGARTARLRRLRSGWSAISRADGEGPRAHRRRPRTTCCCWRLGRRAEGPPSGRDGATRPAGNCGCTPRRSTTTGTSCSIPKKFQFLWVVDFPMFEWDEEDSRWNAAHHPFTSVHDEDLEKLTADPARCRAKSYDLVLNGIELGSGSIRIHRRDMQSKVFAALGFSEEEARRRFGFLLDALEYGAPPHGGIALGWTGW